MRIWLATLFLAGLGAQAVADSTADVEDSPPLLGPVPGEPTVELELSAGTIGGALHAVLGPRTGFSAAAFASAAGTTATGGERMGVGSVGVEVASPGISNGCRYLSLGGTAYRTVTADEHVDSVQTSATVCLFRADVVDVGAPGFTIQHRLDYQVRPALAARRAWFGSRYTGQSFDVDGSAFEGRDSTLPYGSALFPYHVDVDVTGADGDHRTAWAFAVEAVRITPPRTILMGPKLAPVATIHIPADELAILGLFVRGLATGGHELIVGGLDFGRLDGLDVGGGVTMDFQAGIAMGGINTPGMETIETAPRVDVLSPKGYVGAAGRAGPVRWTARYARDVYPTFDGAIAVEDRLSHTVELERWVPGLQLTAFGAHTELYELAGQTGDVTGGASAMRTWRLGDHLALAVTGEVARSYYARLDSATDARPTPEAAARVMAVLTARAGTGSR